MRTYKISIHLSEPNCDTGECSYCKHLRTIYIRAESKEHAKELIGDTKLYCHIQAPMAIYANEKDIRHTIAEIEAEWL